PTNVGTYTVTAIFAGNSNYSALNSTPANVTITAATPTVTATGNTCTYNGSPCAGSGSATGVGGVALPFALSYVGTGGTVYTASPTAPTNVGTYTVTAIFAGNANYSALNSTPANVTITAATPTVTATGNTCTYNGSPCAGSGSATGVGGVVLPFTLSYVGTGGTVYTASPTAPTNVGTYTVTAIFAGNANYSALNSTPANVTITAAAQTITFTTKAPSSAANRTSFPVAATASSGLAVALSWSGTACSTGSATSSATITMTSSTGTCTVTASQGGNTNYSAATPAQETVTATAPPSLTISPASWNIASPMYPGQCAKQPFTVSNPGATSITISSISIPGNNVENPQPAGDPDDYQITGNTCGKT